VETKSGYFSKDVLDFKSLTNTNIVGHIITISIKGFMKVGVLPNQTMLPNYQLSMINYQQTYTHHLFHGTDMQHFV